MLRRGLDLTRDEILACKLMARTSGQVVHQNESTVRGVSEIGIDGSNVAPNCILLEDVQVLWGWSCQLFALS